MRVIYNDFITEEMERIFNEEGTIFLSSDENAWLFTDMEVTECKWLPHDGQAPDEEE